jgi:hypothetical protein
VVVVEEEAIHVKRISVSIKLLVCRGTVFPERTE